MELNVLQRLEICLLTVLMITVTLTGCHSTGKSKWSFGKKHDVEKAEDLATYKENESAVKTDGDIQTPASKAKPEATVALGERRLADSGYGGGPTYNEPLDSLSASDNMTPNYGNVTEMASQANANAAQNAAPVAYKEETMPPMDPNAFPSNVPPMVSSPSQAVASNAGVETPPSDLPPLPDLPPMPTSSSTQVASNNSAMPDLPPMPTSSSTQVASNNSAMPDLPTETTSANNSTVVVASDLQSTIPDNNIVPTNTTNNIAPVNYESEIPESEAQAFTPTTGSFLPGALDVNAYNTNNSQPTTTPSTTPTAVQSGDTNSLYPTTPTDSQPSQLNNQSLPGLSSNSTDSLQNSSQVVTYQKAKVTTISEAEFCSMTYHQVADLVSEIRNESANNSMVIGQSNNTVPVVQTSLIRPVTEREYKVQSTK